jgi:hypothetical protein
MRKIDDTPLPESESDDVWTVLSDLVARIYLLEARVADLETQRTANESNQDDPEWY